MPSIRESTILIMATNGFEQAELLVPQATLREAGATVHVATTDGDAITGWDVDHWGDKVDGDLAIADAKVEDYDAIVLPGGQINPDKLRTEEAAVSLIRDFAAAGKVVAAICHAPWLLIEAGLVEGREVTAFPSIRTDLRNAGADVVDRAVVVSNGIITSRNPDDLDAFVSKIIEEVEDARHERAAA